MKQTIILGIYRAPPIEVPMYMYKVMCLFLDEFRDYFYACIIAAIDIFVHANTIVIFYTSHRYPHAYSQHILWIRVGGRVIKTLLNFVDNEIADFRQRRFKAWKTE